MECCYQLEGDQASWLTRLTEALRPMLDAGLGAQGLLGRRVGYGRLELLAEVYLGPADIQEFTRERLERAGPEETEAGFWQVPPVDIAREAMKRFGIAPEHYEQSLPSGRTIRDHLTVLARDGSDCAVGVSAVAEHEIRISRAQRRALRKLAWHMTAGWRLLRMSPSADGEAVLAPDGDCLHAEGPARDGEAQSALREAARAVDRARGPLRRRDPEEALDLWKGLVSGRWSLVDRFESDGRRYLIAHRNDPRYLDPRKLTRREQQCARLAAIGYANSEVAYALGLQSSTVGSHIHSALRKLGLARRQELAASLAPAPLEDTRISDLDAPTGALRVTSTPAAPPLPEDAGLSPAEREVAHKLVSGLSLRDIGRARGTSARTVANQVQSIYQKLGVSSRSELVASLRERS